MGKKRRRFIKIISFRISLDNFILSMVSAFLIGAAAGVGGMYYGVKFERDRYRASLYKASAEKPKEKTTLDSQSGHLYKL